MLVSNLGKNRAVICIKELTSGKYSRKIVHLPNNDGLNWDKYH